MDNLKSDLSPARITFRGDSIIAAVMIRHEGQWKKFSVRCDTPKELWNTLNSIHERGAQALAEGITPQAGNSGNSIDVTFDYIAHKVKEFLGKGGKITVINPGVSAFATSRIDVDALVAELDNIPSVTEQPAEILEEEEAA